MTEAQPTRTKASAFTDADGHEIEKGDRIKVVNDAGNTLQARFIFDGFVTTAKGNTWIDAIEEHFAKGKRGTAFRCFEPDRVSLHDDVLKARAREAKAAAKRKPGVRTVQRRPDASSR